VCERRAGGKAGEGGSESARRDRRRQESRQRRRQLPTLASLLPPTIALTCANSPADAASLAVLPSDSFSLPGLCAQGAASRLLRVLYLAIQWAKHRFVCAAQCKHDIDVTISRALDSTVCARARRTRLGARWARGCAERPTHNSARSRRCANISAMHSPERIVKSRRPAFGCSRHRQEQRGSRGFISGRVGARLFRRIFCYAMPDAQGVLIGRSW
jgi:hypothetical protein